MNNKEKYERDKKSNPDHIATPRHIVENIYNFIGIENYNNIWFPFNNYDSEFKLKADELKLKYKATHKFDDLGNDFFTTNPPKDCELMISNPPFSIQNKIIEHSFKLVDDNKIKAFCLLLPLATLETYTRGSLYEQYADKMSIIIFKRRIKFIGHSQGHRVGIIWVCYNISNLQPMSWI